MIRSSDLLATVEGINNGSRKSIRRKLLRNYEAMCVFQADQEIFNSGIETVRTELTKLGAQIEKEEDMGIRTLAFPIKKQKQAHYYYYVCKMNPEKAHQTEHALRLKDELLRFLMVRKEE